MTQHDFVLAMKNNDYVCIGIGDGDLCANTCKGGCPFLGSYCTYDVRRKKLVDDYLKTKKGEIMTDPIDTLQLISKLGRETGKLADGDAHEAVRLAEDCLKELGLFVSEPDQIDAVSNLELENMRLIVALKKIAAPTCRVHMMKDIAKEALAKVKG